jgi:hypothetical protein
MKLISTLLAAFAVFLNAQGQFSESFDQNITSLPNDCWLVTQVNYTTTASDVIRGTGSAYTNPPTSGGGERSIATPFLNISSTSLSVSFQYKVSSKISGNATRTINVGLLDKNGVFTSLQLVTMDKTSPTTVLTWSGTYTVPIGTYRVQIKIGGATGDGNSRMIFDDLSVSASPYYGPVSHCNPAAVAVNDSYTSTAVLPFSEAVKSNDQLPADNETYTPALVTAPADGTVVFNPDGTFTYTPAAGFTSGTILFSYQLGDNGFPATTSNIATVSLTYPSTANLPITLRDFSATLKASVVQLKWLVEDMVQGKYFEIEKSIDGKSFGSIAKVAVNDQQSEYSSTDSYTNKAAYYRLKILNNDESVMYSKVVFINANLQLNTLQISNNPVTEALKFYYTSNADISASVEVFSMTGARSNQTRVSLSKGTSEYSIQLGSLQPGTYVMILTTAYGRQSVKFIKR